MASCINGLCMILMYLLLRLYINIYIYTNCHFRWWKWPLIPVHMDVVGLLLIIIVKGVQWTHRHTRALCNIILKLYLPAAKPIITAVPISVIMFPPLTPITPLYPLYKSGHKKVVRTVCHRLMVQSGVKQCSDAVIIIMIINIDKPHWLYSLFLLLCIFVD